MRQVQFVILCIILYLTTLRSTKLQCYYRSLTRNKCQFPFAYSPSLHIEISTTLSKLGHSVKNVNNVQIKNKYPLPL